jgi:hypothetical protein
MEADEVDYQPRVYLWYAKENTVEPVYLPIKKDVISREHLEQKERRDQRIDAFISQLNNWEIDISFEENLKRAEQTNRFRESVMEIVYKAIS